MRFERQVKYKQGILEFAFFARGNDFMKNKNKNLKGPKDGVLNWRRKLIILV